MKKIILLLTLLSFFVGNAISQEYYDEIYDNNNNNQIVVKTNHVSFSLGVNFGIFYPTDVNNYIEDVMFGSSYSGDYYSSYDTYNTELYLNMSLSLGLGYRISEFFELKPMVEFSAAPKVVAMEDDVESYSFNKVSPGVLGIFHIPVGKHKHSFFLGAGPFYNKLSFKEFKDSSLGWRAIAGFSFMNHKSFNPQVYMGWDQAKGTSSQTYTDYEYFYTYNMDLNYSSFKIGTYLNF